MVDDNIFRMEDLEDIKRRNLLSKDELAKKVAKHTFIKVNENDQADRGTYRQVNNEDRTNGSKQEGGLEELGLNILGDYSDESSDEEMGKSILYLE